MTGTRTTTDGTSDDARRPAERGRWEAATTRAVVAPAVGAVLLVVLLAACAEGPGGLSADEAPVTPTEPLEEGAVGPAADDGDEDATDGEGGASASEDGGTAGDDASGAERSEDPLGIDDRTLVGTFGGDASLEGGCAWVDVDGERYELMIRSGARVEFDPLRVVDAGGGVVAEEGDTIQVVGREATDMVSICQVGPIFQATAVLPGTGLLPESPDADS